MSSSDTLSQFFKAAEAAEVASAAAADPPVPRKGNQKPAGTKLSLEKIEADVVQTLATPKYVEEKGVLGMRQYIVNHYTKNGVEVKDIPAKYSGFVNAATDEKLQALVAQATEAFQEIKASRARAKATPAAAAATPAAAAATPAAAAATPAAAAATPAAAAKASRVATKQKHDKKQEQKEPRKDAGSQKPYSKGNAGNKFYMDLGEHAGNPKVKELLSDIESLNQQLHEISQQRDGKQGALAALVKKLNEEAAAAAAAATAAAAAATAAAAAAAAPSLAAVPAPVPASRFINVSIKFLPRITPEKLVEMVRAKMAEMNVTNPLDVISEEQQGALSADQEAAVLLLF
jgi:hypothetical protein